MSTRDRNWRHDKDSVRKADFGVLDVRAILRAWEMATSSAVWIWVKINSLRIVKNIALDVRFARMFKT